MGPKKDPKKEVPKREQGSVIDEPLNTDFWRCVVVMAVERNTTDCFVVREFMKEFSNGRRREVGLIDFEMNLMKLLIDFANGNLPYKYSSMLKFSSVLQEASEYVGKNSEIPVTVLAKVVKIILFQLKEESLIRIEKTAAGPPNPITAMTERPANLGVVADPKKKETTNKKKEEAPKVRPPSTTKEDTKLLKRGECVKSDQCINDAPLNGYFNLYVLLTGFYFPYLPLELIKTGVPLHGLICIDTSQSGVREESTRSHRKPQAYSGDREENIRNFWDVFLKILWDPIICPSFKDTIFQVYIPRSMRCDKDKLREFIFRELSYLMYDMSDFKRQLDNYLTRMKLWNVEETSTDRRFISGLEDIPNECATVPVVLQYIIDAICTDECNDRLKTSENSKESLEGSQLSEMSSTTYPNWYGNCLVQQKWSQVLSSRGDFELLKIYDKTKELDAIYNIFSKNSFNRDVATPHSEKDETQLCNFEFPKCGENMKVALSTDGTLTPYWKKYTYQEGGEFKMDFCLFPIIMTGVFCPYLTSHPPGKSNSFFKKSSNFEMIENLSMRKPHFTVTESSRSILKSIPHNMKETSRDFFNPAEFKIVTPEKLKASSAPQFRVTPKLKIEKFTESELFSREISKNFFENLRDFLGESFLSEVNGFDFLELLGKSKLIETSESWDRYNCIDHAYSVVSDCIFIVLHNRTDGQNVHHETFNKILKTAVGLRDFYDYVLDDESDWFTCEEEIYKKQFTKNEKSFHNLLSTVYSDSDFWMVDSIKNKYVNKAERDIQKLNSLISKKYDGTRRKSRFKYLVQAPVYDFEGYNVSNMAVQFSGLKTVYYSNDSSVIVELIERLYGKQDLGIHVTAAGHALHLYSYACPEPHILHPFAFHITYNNGIIVAFQRRFVEKFEEVDEILESKTLIKGKKNSSEMSTRVVKKLISKTVQDEEFCHDMVVTLPNGLSVRTVRKMVEPCYIKQKFLSRSVDNNGEEISRLFLPNGNVVKMKNDKTFEIFKPDTTVIRASLDDLQNESGNVSLEKFNIISSEGYSSTFENEQMSSSVRLQILQNADLDGDQIFFRRRDGTNYRLLNDGTLCVEFKDGTKMSSTLIVKENVPIDIESGNNFPEENSQKISEENSQENSAEENSQNISMEENSQESSTEGSSQENSMEENSQKNSTGEKSRENSAETEPEMDFVFVYTKITMEHPDYATVVYDSSIEKWIIHLPQDSLITVGSDGRYTVEIDNRTDVRVDGNVIQMSRCTVDGKLDCTTTADLSVFENSDGNVYCHMEDSNRKIFIVEANSNCYILEEDKSSVITDVDVVSSDGSHSQQSVLSEFVASADLQSVATVQTEKFTKLSQSSRYFVVMRDITGFELLHTDNVEKLLTEKKSGSLIFIENVPDTENRIFVLLTPETDKNCKKWQVCSIIPNPVYVPNTKPKLTSSTYGIPPSWLHPFPKRKNKFKPPDQISCRVFIETKKTELSPPVGVIDCYFCEVDDIQQPPIIPQYGVDEYFQKLKHNDQDLLKHLYTIVAESLINEKKKLKPDNSEKVEHYLQLSRYYVDLQDYHKKCIRYHTVPKYFHHPDGMSWLILNGWVNRLKLSEEKSKPEVPVIETDGNVTTSSKSTSSYSYEEIEYNLSVRSDIGSYTDLSYRSELSAQTAPPVLRTGGVCKCKLSGLKDIVSSPVVKCYGEENVHESLEEIPMRECDFKENDLEILEKIQHEAPLKTLEDLICLGLI